MTDVLSVEYIGEYQMLQKNFSDVTKPRDNAVSKKKDHQRETRSISSEKEI